MIKLLKIFNNIFAKLSGIRENNELLEFTAIDRPHFL